MKLKHLRATYSVHALPDMGPCTNHVDNEGVTEMTTIVYKAGEGGQGSIYVDKKLFNVKCRIVYVTKIYILIKIVGILTIPIFFDCR